MTTSTLSAAQVVSLVKHLPAATRRQALFALARTASAGRQRRRRLAQAELRRLATARGKEWDGMTEDDREQFVDALLHEGKACR